MDGAAPVPDAVSPREAMDVPELSDAEEDPPVQLPARTCVGVWTRRVNQSCFKKRILNIKRACRGGGTRAGGGGTRAGG